MFRGSLCFTLALAVALTAIGPTARGDEASSDAAKVATDRKAAAKAFAEGEQAFREGDFVRAAEAFDAAYKLAPHVDPLWNAAQAWHHAGESARAANRYAKYLRDAPPDAVDRNHAASALAELSAKLGRVDVYAPDATDVTIDGAPIDASNVFVNPGAHVVEARVAGHVISRKTAVDAGGVVSVALVEEPPPLTPSATATTAPPIVTTPPRAPAPAPTTSATARPVASDSRGLRVLSPWFIVGEGVLVATGAGLSIASGIDTNNAAASWQKNPETRVQSVEDDGFAKEHRTNILIGATAGALALTAATALWLIDWDGKPSKRGASFGARAGVGANGLLVRGSFE